MLSSWRHFKGMAAVLLAVLSLQLVGAERAEAACTDPPAPGVNWQRCALDGLNLTELNLQDARVRASSFLRADLSDSDLSGVEGYQAKFVTVTANNVVFDEAKLFQADFTKADLEGASFRGADLRSARLYRANLRDADLTGAKLEGADITRAELSGATWTDGTTVCAEGSVGRCNWR